MGYVDFDIRIRAKTSDDTPPPTDADVTSAMTLALMRSEVWLIQSLGEMEIELTSVDIVDFGGFNDNHFTRGFKHL
jgi:hypothetical protein